MVEILIDPISNTADLPYSKVFQLLAAFGKAGVTEENLQLLIDRHDIAIQVRITCNIANQNGVPGCDNIHWTIPTLKALLEKACGEEMMNCFLDGFAVKWVDWLFTDLSPDELTILWLRYGEELNYHYIADQTEWSPKYIREKIEARGLQKVRLAVEQAIFYLAFSDIF